MKHAKAPVKTVVALTLALACQGAALPAALADEVNDPPDYEDVTGTSDTGDTPSNGIRFEMLSESIEPEPRTLVVIPTDQNSGQDIDQGSDQGQQPEGDAKPAPASTDIVSRLRDAARRRAIERGLDANPNSSSLRVMARLTGLVDKLPSRISMLIR